MLSGFTPVMPVFSQYLTYANPIRFFMNITRGLFLKEMGFVDVLVSWPLGGHTNRHFDSAARSLKKSLE